MSNISNKREHIGASKKKQKNKGFKKEEKRD